MSPENPDTAEGYQSIHELWRLAVRWPENANDAELTNRIFNALEDTALSIYVRRSKDGEGSSIELIASSEPDRADVAARLNALEETGASGPITVTVDDIECDILPDKNWVEHVHKTFPPVMVGRFFVYGSHYDGDMPDDLTPLRIDAATAFGTGEHETTRGCLMALQDFADNAERFENVLDMGCGSGILSIAIAKLWPDIEKITAVDMDETCVKVTNRHAGFNDCADKIICERSAGYDAAIVGDNAPYDLIACNILTRPLIELAPQVPKHLKDGGYVVLGGLLVRDHDAVLGAHEEQGLELVHSIVLSDWEILVLRKGGDA